MRKLLYIVLSFLLLASCAGQRRHNTALRRAHAILNYAPDSALTLLDSMETFSSEFSRGTLMRWQLLHLSAQNKCDTVFRSDSLQLVLVKYFDRQGTPNERMMAHYLLGRAYSDMSQPLYAIRAFLDASAAVDTLSADCDWWNLTRVYMQLAQEYYDTYLPRELLSALEKAHNSSLRAGDTVTSIMSIGSKYDAYELLGMKDSASLVVRQAAMMYEAIGRHDLSSQVLSLLITPESEAGHVDTAASIIHYYEGFSGYFDSDHRIRRGMESYYYAKGIYYLHSDAPDSAEWMFRTLLEENTDLNGRHAAYLGLSKK
ncbi:MAG: hypothetical protein J5682_05725, partial [Prevotella sp.]|nr:hypothetical protein [Prevotella sp.]